MLRKLDLNGCRSGCTNLLEINQCAADGKGNEHEESVFIISSILSWCCLLNYADPRVFAGLASMWSDPM